MEELYSSLKEEALLALKNTFGANISAGKKVILAVDASLQVILEILAQGAGGQEFYTKLNITRIVSIPFLNADQVRQKLSLQRNIVLHDTTIVFLVNPTCMISKIIADTVRNHEFGLSWMIMWISSPTSDCTLELERQGVSGFVKQCHLALGLLPVDKNALSLCQDGIFNDLYLKQDPKSLTQIVHSLLSIEKIMGSQIKDISCYGNFSQQVKSMLEMAHKIIFPLGNDGNNMYNNNSSRTAGTGSTGVGTTSNKEAPVMHSMVFFHKLILIDRLEDPFSMLLTPMTYEGLLDGLIGLNHGVVVYEKDINPSAPSPQNSQTSQTSQTQTSLQKVYLNHQVDELYGEIRDINFNLLISSVLNEIVQEFAAEARPKGSSTTIPTQNIFDISNLLKKMPSLVKKKKSLSHHLDLVSIIKTKASQQFHLRLCIESEMKIICAGKSIKAGEEVDLFLEETLLRGDTNIALHDVLKILCLRSMITGGFKENENKLKWYRKQLCHTYGHAQVVPLLIHLEKIHLFSKNSKKKWNFHTLKKQFHLIQAFLEDEETKQPKDIHFMFPYTGYAPLSVRLVQEKLHLKFSTSTTSYGTTSSNNGSINNSSKTGSILSNNNNNKQQQQQQQEETGTHKRTASFEQMTKRIMSSSSSSNTASSNGGTNTSNSGPCQQILVYYIGGVTVAEMAAFRYLNTKYTGQFHFTIASTNITNSQRLFRNFSSQTGY